MPDLILHERNSGNNYCVIEVKYSVNTNVEDDYQKDYNSLIDIIRTHNYQYAISLIISPTDAHLTWFTTEKIESPLVYIDKEQKQSIDATIKHCGEYAIYHGVSLPQCAKNALNSLTNERNFL